jgi:hypothetical protein
MRSSSILKKIEVVFQCQKLRLSSIFKKDLGHRPFSFLLGFLSSWVKIRLHNENKLPMLPASALKVSVVVCGVGQPITFSNQS